MKYALLVTGALFLSGGVAFAQEDPNMEGALRQSHKSAPSANTNVTPALLVPPAQICFTCGSPWPVYGGTIPTSGPARERGPGCSGPFTTNFNDENPFLCVR